MRTLVVYYSRTRTTKKAAEAIAVAMSADLDEVIDLKDRSGPAGFLMGGRDASVKKLTDVRCDKDPSMYDFVIIGTPVWAFTMAPAIRTYITKNKDKLKEAAFFCTQGGSGAKRTFRDMESLCQKKGRATLELMAKDVVNDKFTEKIKEFVIAVKGGAA